MPDIPFLPDISVLNNIIYNPLATIKKNGSGKGEGEELHRGKVGGISNIRLPELESLPINSHICNWIYHS